jgi:DNA-binding transcriptional ArsR family regulator
VTNGHFSIPDEKWEDVRDSLRAILDDSRALLLATLTDRRMSVKDISSEYDMTQPRVSFHLKKLMDHGLVTFHSEGRSNYYYATDKGIMIMGHVEAMSEGD